MFEKGETHREHVIGGSKSELGTVDQKQTNDALDKQLERSSLGVTNLSGNGPKHQGEIDQSSETLQIKEEFHESGKAPKGKRCES